METFILIAKSAAILTLFYVVYLMVLRRYTFFNANRHYLLAGIIAALVFPFIEFTKTVYREAPIFANTPVFDTSFSSEIVSTLPQEAVFEINWWIVALVIYGVGVTVMLTRFLIQLFSLYALLRRSMSRKMGNFIFAELQDNIAPFSFFNYICYNPALHTTQELEMIITHEKVHATQYHTIDVLLTQVLLALQWCNPLVWFYKKSIEQNLEFIADQKAIGAVPSATAYQHTLVKVSSTALRPALTNQFYHSLIKKRILMLNKETSHKRNLWKLGLVLPLLALFMYSFNIKEVVEYTQVGSDKMDLGGKVLETVNGKQGDDDDVVEYAFAKAKNEEPLLILPTTTDAEIETITQKLEDAAENLKIRFTNRKRNAQGILVNLQVETKYPSQNRFYENVTFSNKKNTSIPDIYLEIVNGNDLQFSNTDGKLVFRTSEDGVKTELFSKEYDGFPNLGKNPAYIINNEIKTSEEVKDKILQLDGDAKLLGKEEAIVKYGQKAKDGALVLNGTTIIKDKESTKTEKAESPTNEVFMKINKNTTDAQLLAYKEELKRDHSIDLSYNLRRNAAQEITMIQISYTGNGKNGNYSISGDNPIDEFFFFIDEKGKTGFWSEKSEERLKDRKTQMDARRAQLEKAREERRGALEGRREQLEEAREERKEALQERKEAIKKRQKEMLEDMKKRNPEVSEKQNKSKERGMIEINGDTYLYDTKNGKTRYFDKFGTEVDKNGKKLNLEDGAQGYEKINGEDVYYVVKNGEKEYFDRFGNKLDQQGLSLASNTNKTIRITKDSSDDEIEMISSRLKKEGVSFIVNKLKRNNKGEIVHYSINIQLKNSNLVTVKSRSEKNAIDTIVISYDDEGKVRIRHK